MRMNVKKFADFTGVSVRTLHYYDEIGLLKPFFVDEENGYRYYGEKEAERMQEILFYRELDFTLKQIKEIISSTTYDKTEALKEQKTLLILKKERLEKVINALENAEKGEGIMDFKAFDKKDFENYKKEVKERWGHTQAYRESLEKSADYGDIADGISTIMKAFGDAKKSGASADSEVVQVLVKQLQNFITKTQYNCTNEILLCLGEMYIADERFKENIDKYGIGNAQFINEAIKIYCK